MSGQRHSLTESHCAAFARVVYPNAGSYEDLKALLADELEGTLEMQDKTAPLPVRWVRHISAPATRVPHIFKQLRDWIGQSGMAPRAVPGSQQPRKAQVLVAKALVHTETDTAYLTTMSGKPKVVEVTQQTIATEAGTATLTGLATNIKPGRPVVVAVPEALLGGAKRIDYTSTLNESALSGTTGGRC